MGDVRCRLRASFLGLVSIRISPLRLLARSRAGLESPLLAIRPAAGFVAGALSGSRTGAADDMLPVGATAVEAMAAQMMHRDGCPLIMGGGPCVSEKAGALVDRRLSKMPTNGHGGACGIRALFGSDRPGG